MGFTKKRCIVIRQGMGSPKIGVSGQIVMSWWSEEDEATTCYSAIQILVGKVVIIRKLVSSLRPIL